MAAVTLLAYLIPLSLAILFLKQALSTVTTKCRQSEKLPPGPTGLPIIGNLHNILGTVPLHQTLSRLSRKHGPIMFLKLGTVPTVVVSSAKSAKEFMTTHDLDSCSRPRHTSTAKVTYNFLDVAFCPYGPHWKDAHRLLIAEFTGPRSVRLNRSVREEEVHRMIASIASNAGRVVDVSSVLEVLSTDVMCRAAFGRREGRALHGVMEEMRAVLGGFFFADYLPALGWLDSLTGMRARLEKLYSALDGLYEEVIEEHMDPARRVVEGGEGDCGEGDFVGAMLQKNNEGNSTKEHIKALLMNILIAGIDAPFIVVEWAMSELMRNPQWREKVQNEVRRVVGNKGKADESDLPQLRYMRCVVMEVLRLHLPGPLLIQRETMRGFDVGHFHIPAKTTVIINAWAMGREERIWGTKHDCFYPERFVDSDIDMKGNDFGFAPFGAGRRMCPGMQLGLALVELALANLLHSFNWELPEGMTEEDLDMDETSGITVGRKNPLLLVASKYNGMNG